MICACQSPRIHMVRDEGITDIVEEAIREKPSTTSNHRPQPLPSSLLRPRDAGSARCLERGIDSGVGAMRLDFLSSHDDEGTKDQIARASAQLFFFLRVDKQYSRRRVSVQDRKRGEMHRTDRRKVHARGLKTGRQASVEPKVQSRSLPFIDGPLYVGGTALSDPSPVNPPTPTTSQHEACDMAEPVKWPRARHAGH